MLLAICALVLQRGQAQVSVANNNPTTGDFVGCDFLNGIPLEIRHDAGDQPIGMYSTGDANPEVFLTPTLTGIDYGGYYPFTYDASGNLGVGTGFSMTFPPLTKLHIGDNGTNPTGGFRDWMKSGLMNTEGTDGMYVGLKDEGSPGSYSAILNWSDNRLSDPDPLRFIFTGGGSGSSAMETSEGLELARILPDPDGDEGYFGIGDFNAASASPTERLHVLDGRVRIQQLPDDMQTTLPYKVMVVDNSATPSLERGVVKWVDPAAFNCEWTLQGPPGTNSHISTAYLTNTGCPLMNKGVAIGLQYPKAKLHVYHNDFSELLRTGVWSQIETQTGGLFPFRAVHGIVNPLLSDQLCSGTSIGVAGDSKNARQTIGTQGDVLMDTGDPGSVALIGARGIARVTNNRTAALVNGVWGWATVDPFSSSGFSAGVIGGISAPANVPNVWAGYFFGNVHSTGVVTWASDQNLKSGAEPLSSATAILAALQPKRYEFRTEEYPQLNLPQGQHLGLIAQEVQVVLPELVTPVSSPALLDSSGNTLVPGVDYLSLNYTELIPVLIAGNQELVARINALEQQVAACCSADEGQRTSKQEKAVALETDLRTLPNPVADRTELRYTVGTEGRVRLEITDATSRTIQVQDEGSHTTGAYVYEWNTTTLAAGTYYCTLYVNDEPLVKKAVKLNAR
jgi:hypothetical protein